MHITDFWFFSEKGHIADLTCHVFFYLLVVSFWWIITKISAPQTSRWLGRAGIGKEIIIMHNYCLHQLKIAAAAAAAWGGCEISLKMTR